MPANCQEGTNGSKWHDGYEDALFEEQLLKVIEEHDPAIPLFVFWGTNNAPLLVPLAKQSSSGALV
jgi:hypothetical protein